MVVCYAWCRGRSKPWCTDSTSAAVCKWPSLSPSNLCPNLVDPFPLLRELKSEGLEPSRAAADVFRGPGRAVAFSDIDSRACRGARGSACDRLGRLRLRLRLCRPVAAIGLQGEPGAVGLQGSLRLREFQAEVSCCRSKRRRLTGCSWDFPCPLPTSWVSLRPASSLAACALASCRQPVAERRSNSGCFASHNRVHALCRLRLRLATIGCQ